MSTPNHFQILNEKEEYRDGERFQIMRATLKTPADEQVHWAYIKGREGVVVVARTEDNHIYIKNEWRLGRNQSVWEFPSGWIEVDTPTESDILEAANRELQEEVGIKAQSLHIIRTFFPLNHSNIKMHIVLAENLQESKLPPDTHEFIGEVEVVPFKNAYHKLIHEQTPNAQTIVAFEALKTFFKGV